MIHLTWVSSMPFSRTVAPQKRRIPWNPISIAGIFWLCQGPVLAQSDTPAERPSPATQPVEVDEAQTQSADSYETSDRSFFGWKAAPIDEPLITDRPDFTESPQAVPLGRIQLEMGYLYTYDSEDDVRTRSSTGPQMLWRIGFAENWEARIGWNGYTWTDTHSATTSRAGRRVSEDNWDQGANDLSLGFKVQLIEQDGLVPDLGIIGGISVPSGSAGTSSGDAEPEVIFLWGYDITEWFAIAGNIGLRVPTDNGDRFFQTTASLSLGFALTDRWGTFVEYFGLYPNANDTDCAHFIDGGFTYLITDNLQLDAFVGFGLNEEADDFFTGVGFSWRF